MVYVIYKLTAIYQIYKQNILIKMEKIVRHRKPYYQKENDQKNGNKKKIMNCGIHQNLDGTDTLDKYWSHSHHLKPQNIHHIKPTEKDNTQLYCELYGKQLINIPEHSIRPNYFLNGHQVDGALRSRMLDWMIEVTSSYKFTGKTYFDSVQLMDRYFQAEKESIPATKLHNIGIQSMLIASKMNEVYPLKIKTVYEKIAHKKLSILELVQTQENIMKKLNYKLNSWTFFDIAMLKISMHHSQHVQERQALGELVSKNQNCENQSLKTKKSIQLEELCILLSKFAIFNYDFYCQNSPQLLAESVIKAAFQILGVTKVSYDFYSCSPIMIQLCKQNILKMINSFKQRNGDLNNIFRFSPKDIMVLVNEFIDK